MQTGGNGHFGGTILAVVMTLMMRHAAPVMAGMAMGIAEMPGAIAGGDAIA